MHFITTKLIVSILIGGGLGFLYYKFIGCSTNACPITSNPISSIVYGMIIGAFFGLT